MIRRLGEFEEPRSGEEDERAGMERNTEEKQKVGKERKVTDGFPYPDPDPKRLGKLSRGGPTDRPRFASILRGVGIVSSGPA